MLFNYIFFNSFNASFSIGTQQSNVIMAQRQPILFVTLNTFHLMSIRCVPKRLAAKNSQVTKTIFFWDLGILK